MDPSGDSEADLHIKFELTCRRRASFVPWLVIGLALIGLVGHLVHMWIET